MAANGKNCAVWAAREAIADARLRQTKSGSKWRFLPEAGAALTRINPASRSWDNISVLEAANAA